METDAPAAPAFGWPEIAIAFAVAYLGSAIVGAAYLSIEGLPADTDLSMLSLGVQAITAVPLWIGFGLVPVVAVLRKGRDIRDSLGIDVRPLDVPLGLVIGAVCQYPGVAIASWPLIEFFDVSTDEIEERAENLADLATGAGGVVLLVLIVVVMAPLVEEILFRGAIQRTIGRSLPPVATIVTTGLVFAVTHFEPVQIPALFFFGVVLSTLAHRTGRLGMAWAAHVGFNLTTVVVLLS